MIFNHLVNILSRTDHSGYSFFILINVFPRGSPRSINLAVSLGRSGGLYQGSLSATLGISRLAFFDLLDQETRQWRAGEGQEENHPEDPRDIALEKQIE